MQLFYWLALNTTLVFPFSAFSCKNVTLSRKKIGYAFFKDVSGKIDED